MSKPYQLVLDNPSFILAISKKLITGKEYSNQEVKEILSETANKFGYTKSIPATAIVKITTNSIKLDTYRSGFKFRGYRIGDYNITINQLNN